jgi:hypothetical protein
VSLLQSAPGIAWVLGFTIASEIGDISRFSSPNKLMGYTGLCPRVYQSGGKDFRGRVSKNGPKYLRWSLIEAAVHASSHPIYKDHYDRTKARLGRQRGAKVARSKWPASSPRPSGTCSRRARCSLRQGPTPRLWSLDDPRLRWTSRSSPTRPFPPSRMR